MTDHRTLCAAAMDSAKKPAPGGEISFAYPFCRTTVTLYDDNGSADVRSWRPGVRPVFCYPDDFENIADGVGKQVCHIVSVHKPGKYPERVFYTRSWVDPSGKKFGKPGLRIITTSGFKALCRGYRHDFRMARPDDPEPEDEQ